jgi:hypothetical protein
MISMALICVGAWLSAPSQNRARDIHQECSRLTLVHLCRQHQIVVLADEYAHTKPAAPHRLNQIDSTMRSVSRGDPGKDGKEPFLAHALAQAWAMAGKRKATARQEKKATRETT